MTLLLIILLLVLLFGGGGGYYAHKLMAVPDSAAYWARF